MKILWIVNVVLNDFSRHLYKKEGNGVWMDALLEDFKQKGEHEVIVATVLPIKETVKYACGGVTALRRRRGQER